MNFTIQYKLRVINTNFICFQVKIIISFVILHRNYVYGSSNQFSKVACRLTKWPLHFNLSGMMTKPILGTTEIPTKRGSDITCSETFSLPIIMSSPPKKLLLSKQEQS